MSRLSAHKKSAQTNNSKQEETANLPKIKWQTPKNEEPDALVQTQCNPCQDKESPRQLGWLTSNSSNTFVGEGDKALKKSLSQNL